MNVIFVGGKYDGITKTIFEVEKIGNGARSRDWTKERESGGIVPRKELDNLPLVDGYLTPMWDDGKIRYETPEIYAALST